MQTSAHNHKENIEIGFHKIKMVYNPNSFHYDSHNNINNVPHLFGQTICNIINNLSKFGHF